MCLRVCLHIKDQLEAAKILFLQILVLSSPDAFPVGIIKAISKKAVPSFFNKVAGSGLQKRETGTVVFSVFFLRWLLLTFAKNVLYAQFNVANC